MINYITGNLFTSNDKIWLHGCNAQGKFASGIAGQIRKKLPYAYNAYIHQFQTMGLHLGDVIYAIDNSTHHYPIIANCITQEFYGYDNKCYVSYEAIEKCVNAVISYTSKLGIENVSMPMIGAGLGGGKWDIIENIINNINDIYPDVNINVYRL